MDPVLVLDAAMTLAAARSALSLATPRITVVVRRLDPRASGAILWYPLSEHDLQAVVRGDLDPAMPLGVSLDLHEHGASQVRQLTHPDVAGGFWTGLVVDGSRAVGWMSADPHDTRGPSRGIDFGAGIAPPAPRPSAPGLAPVVADQAGPGDGAGAEGAPDAGEASGAEGGKSTGGGASAGAGTGTEGGTGAGVGTDTIGEPIPAVPAYPRVDVPDTVGSGLAFTVVVGLSKQAQPGVQGAVMNIAADHQPLIVQIKAENFTLAGVRFELPFDPADVAAQTVTIPVTAPVVHQNWRGRIEIEYSQDGLLVGTAWRELVVSPQAPADAPPSTSGGEVAVELDHSVPIDLTVSISRGEADGTFLWTFTTPHPVPLPDHQVITHLDDDTAETFALKKVREMARVDGSDAAELKVNGVAREVAAVMPLEFWTVLAPVWRLAKDDDRLPTLLLVSQESLVPWELATTDADYIVDRTLVDQAAPQLLGAQLILGRWRPAGPETPSGMRRPSTTPAETIAVGGIAVVVGEFGPSSGMRPLKMAVEEGQQLTAAYQPSFWVKGTLSDVSSLLKGTYTDRGAPISAQVLHVASHGEVDPDSPINTGVILSDSAVRIDESIVVGSDFTRTAAPLVFLNCCQLATETGGSLIEGGLAAAFLQAGARAFVAPLWSVDDTIAKQTALSFYADAFAEARPVGEVMRRLRARFTTDYPARNQTTPLAYAYYGHPGLILSRQEPH